jgi:L-gulonolactone oxidase
MSTGAHGSTLWGKGSVVHDHVTHITIVSPAQPQDGFVKVRHLNESHQDLNAARVSLGVLGVIYRVCVLIDYAKLSLDLAARKDEKHKN